MSKPVRRRGRPIGTTKPGDEALLRMMADLMVSRPQLTPTAAIKQLVTDWNDTILHRLRGKWKAQQATLLAEARERCKAQSAGRSGQSAHIADPATIGARHSLAIQLERAMDHPTIRAAQGLPDSVMRRAMGLDYDAVTRAATGYESSVAREAARTMEKVHDAIFGFTHRSMATGVIGPYLEELYGPRYGSILRGSVL